MNPQRIRLPLLAATLLAGIPFLSAADVSWVGNTSNLWNVGANWSTGAIPTSGSTLVFGAPGSSGVAISDDITSLTVGGSNTDGIVFGSTAAGYTITRTGTLTLGSSGTGIGIKDTSLFVQSIVTPSFSSNQTVQVGDTTGAALSTLTISAGFSGGTFRLTKTGTGLLQFSSSGSTLGGLTVNQGTVSIGNDVQIGTAPGSATVGWITLNGGTLRVNANTPFAINANRGIALGDGATGSGGTLNLFSTSAASDNTLAATYNGIIANNGGSNSLTKTGFQVLSLGGANTYTGATKLNQGQLTLDFTAGTAPTSNIISSNSNLVMGDMPTSLANAKSGSPILLVQGSNTATTSQTFNGTAIHPGNASFMARGGSSTFNTTIALGTLTHSAGGTVGFSLLTGGSTGQGVITTTAANTNGILGGWATTAATVGTGTVPLTQTDWAMVDGSNNIVAYAGYTIPTGASPTLANTAASNVRIDSSSTLNVTPSFASTVADLNTIQMIDTTAVRTIVVGTGNTLRLGAFGGIWNSSNKALTIGASGAGGTLTAGGAASTAGEIVFNTVAGITVNSVIADNGSGFVVNVVKTGSSTLTLTAASSFTGGMFINQGTVSSNNAAGFGGGSVTVMTGGVANLTGTGLTYANNFNIAGSALTPGGNTVSGTVTLLGDSTIGNTTTGGIFTGKITGDYNLSFLGVSSTLSNTTNDFGGNLGINGSGAASIGTNPVTVKLGASNVVPNGAGKGNVYITGSTTAGNYSILDLNGQTETINGLVSSGTAAQARITNTNAATATLTLGDNDQTATYAGTILDGTGKVAITKIGAGTQTFGGANTYTGNTTISAGTLALGASGSFANSPVINLGSSGTHGTLDLTSKASFSFGTGQTVAGYGTINIGTGKVVTVLGTLAPGNSPGIVSVTGDLTLGGASTTNYEITGRNGGSPVAGTDFDQTLVSGTVTFAGTFNINTTVTGLLGGDTFQLFNAGTYAGHYGTVTIAGTYSPTLAYNGTDAWTGLDSGSGLNFSFSEATGYLSIAIPEPSTYAALFGALVLASVVMGRRRRAVKASA